MNGILKPFKYAEIKQEEKEEKELIERSESTVEKDGDNIYLSSAKKESKDIISDDQLNELREKIKTEVANELKKSITKESSWLNPNWKISNP